MARRTTPPVLMVLALLLTASCGGGGNGGGGAGGGCDGTPFPNPGVIDAQSFSFVVNGAVATMNGVIDGTAPVKVQNLITNFPNVTEILMVNCPGSADDDSNIVAAKMVRAAGLNTRVPANGVIASGAVDFFIAGVQRVAEPGSQLHVHTWVGGDGTLGRDLPASDCDHALFLQYYQDMALPDPSGFYFFTLMFGNAPDGLPTHDMTPEERAQYGVTTP